MGKKAQCKNDTIKLAYAGACKSCITQCPHWPYRPVCGTNGVTYKSSCHLLNAQCKNTGIMIAYYGRCSTPTTGRPLSTTATTKVPLVVTTLPKISTTEQPISKITTTIKVGPPAVGPPAYK